MKTININRSKTLTTAILFCSLLFSQHGILLSQGQNVGINTTGALPDNSAGLDINFSNKGVLIPRVGINSATDATTITSPATSLLIYNDGTGGFAPAGFYYWDGSQWVQIGATGPTGAQGATGSAGAQGATGPTGSGGGGCGIAGTASISPTSGSCSGFSTTLTLTGYTGSVIWQYSSDGTSFTNFGSGTPLTVTAGFPYNQFRAWVSNTNCSEYSNLVFVNYTCSSNQWCQKANYPGGSSTLGAAFSIGTKAYYLNGMNSKTLWEYDPAYNVWSQKSDYAHLVFSAVGFSIGTKGYVGTGQYSGTSYDDFYEYDPTSNQWTAKTPYGGGLRKEASGFSIGSFGYIGTGKNSVGTFQTSFYRYDPGADSWTAVASIPSAVSYASGYSVSGKGYVVCGENGPAQTTNYEYTPGSPGSWATKAAFPGAARIYAIAFSIGSKGYVGTGYSPQMQDFYEYNPGTDGWTAKANVGGGVVGYATGFSIDTDGDAITDKGYLAGGDGIPGNDFWEYCP